VLEAYLDRTTLRATRPPATRRLKRSIPGLTNEEAAILALLESRLAEVRDGSLLRRQLRHSLARLPAKTRSASRARRRTATRRTRND
jgi:hypothetical protein